MRVKEVYKENVVDHSSTCFTVDKQLHGMQVEKMEYHEPRGEGDAHYVDVHKYDGEVIRVFRPDEITFAEEDE